MKKIAYILFFATLLPVCLKADDDKDKQYIRKFKSIITLKLGLTRNGLSYSVVPVKNGLLSGKDAKLGQVNYIPYNPFLMGGSVNLYGLVSFSYYVNAFKSGTLNETNYNSFSVSYTGRWLFLEGYYQKYNKLYFSSGSGNRYKIDASNFRDDLRFFNLGLNNFFVFKPKKYSYNAAFSQTSIQLKSSGSFMLMNYYNYNQAISDTGLIPSASREFYPTLSDLKLNRQITYALAPGYAYTFAKNKFYLAFAMFIGPGMQLQRYTTLTDKKFDSAISLFQRYKVSMGYNSEYFFTGFYLNAEMMKSNLKDISTKQNLFNYGYYLGVRLIKNKKESKKK